MSFWRRWVAEYEAMLKAPELEEPLDLVVYRPLAFVLVKILAPTAITPNQVTLAGLLPGLASAWCFWQGTPTMLMAGAILLFLTNVLDCVDGMLARVRGSGSLVGYILDGLADYTIQATLVICLLHGIATQTGDVRFAWLFGVPAGISFAWWSARVDRFRNEWLERVYGRRRDPREELLGLRAQAEVWRVEGTHHAERALVHLYATYIGLWYSGPCALNALPQDESLAAWKRRRLPALRMAVLMGPTMHLSLIMLAGVLAKPAWYVWVALVFGTSWGIVALGLRVVSDHQATDQRAPLDLMKGLLHASRAAGRRAGDTPASSD